MFRVRVTGVRSSIGKYAGVSVALAVICLLIAGCGGGASGGRHNSQQRSNPGHRHSGQSRRSEASGPKPLGLKGNWKLILNSNFGRSRFQGNLWRPGWFGTGVTGPINTSESACYTSGNVSFPASGGVDLALTAKHSHCRGETHRFTGSILSTNPSDGRSSGGFQYRYGLLEAKVYLPADHGRLADWPVVAALGQSWPTDGEDDVIEGLAGHGCFDWHSPGYAVGKPLGGCRGGVRPGWNTVASLWTPEAVTFYYNGIKVGHFTKGITSALMYLVVLNTASVLIPQYAKPATMRVAWVRVWQLTGEAAVNAGYAHSS